MTTPTMEKQQKHAYHYRIIIIFIFLRDNRDNSIDIHPLNSVNSNSF